MRVMQIHFWGDARNLTGSVEKVLRGFAELDDPDIELDIASIGEGEPERHGQANYLFFAESQWRNRVLNKWLGLKAFTYPALIRLIEQRRPEILHLHNRQEFADAIVARLSYRPKVLLHYHRHFQPYRLAQCADGLVAVSASVREDLLQKAAPEAPAFVVHNPLPAYLLTGTAQAGEHAGKLRLLYAGGRQKHKGWDEFETAFLTQAGLAEHFEIRLCGPQLDGYQPRFAASNCGMLDQQRFMQELHWADVVVMPSHHEGLPLMALEALATGKVLVSTEAGGLKEVVTPDSAFVFPVGDHAALAAALLQVAERFGAADAQVWQQHAAAARAAAMKFSVPAVTRQLADVYKEVVR